YNTILESENFRDLQSELVFDNVKSYFFVNMQPDELVEKKNEGFELVNNNQIEYQFDLTLKRPTRHEVFVDRQKGYILSQSSIFKDGIVKPCVVSEKTGSIEWVIKNEYKKIGAFNVQKALTQFRGRKYTAWFSVEIPISAGPWKFHGLPGLILEIQDEELGVQFLFSSIKIPYNIASELKKPSLGSTISLQEYIRIDNEFEEEFIRFFQAKLPRDFAISNITFNSVDRSIEREYENSNH
ncbi:MAG: GLPGLI family protein, partial [Pseudomonadota bacterium]|nr:GLPGLI family protein [Pseudomonadota bacterium]